MNNRYELHYYISEEERAKEIKKRLLENDKVEVFLVDDLVEEGHMCVYYPDFEPYKVKNNQ